MRILVFVKSVPDPEAPPGAIRFAGGVQADAVKVVLGPFEANALELALQLSEQSGGGFRAIAAGGAEQEIGLRRALALGAEEALLAAAPPGPDPLATARRLQAAAEAAGGADLYLFGRQAGDHDLGVTAGLFAGVAGLAFAPLVQLARLAADGLFLRREIPGGCEECTIPLPAVLSVSNGPATRPRLPKVRDAMAAQRRPIRRLDPDALAGEALDASFRPADQGRRGRRIAGDLPEMARLLAGEIRRAARLGGA